MLHVRTMLSAGQTLFHKPLKILLDKNAKLSSLGVNPVLDYELLSS